MTESNPSGPSSPAQDTRSVESWAMQAPHADVAQALEARDPAERVRLLNRIPRERWPAIVRHLGHPSQAALVGALDRNAARELLEALETDDRTRFFEELPDADRAPLLDLLGPDARRETVRLLAYPPESVGRLMSLSYAAVVEQWRVGEALDHLRTLRLAPDAIATVYVTARDGRLVDALDLACFVLAEPASAVREIMDGTYVAIMPTEDRERAVRLMQKHDLLALPVVDAAGVLVGVATVDDVMQVAEEEASEDIERQAGIAPLRATYPDIAARSLFQKRLPWLAALIFVYLGASGVISAFEDALAAELVLAAFIPLLMGSGGNVGAQSGTLVVRALAIGSLERQHWLQALRKELAVGIALGIALGVLAGVVAYVRGGADLALVVGASMGLIVVVANLTGAVFPVLLERAGLDPAVAASPVITSVTDLTSLVIYLGTATWLLGI